MCIERDEHQMMKNKRYRLVEHMKRIPRRQYLMTIRYDNNTHQEMKDCVSQNAKRGIKCVYGCPKAVSDCVIRDTVLMVLEMNNDENRIEGVGMVRNTIQDRAFKIHDDGNLNRFAYVGTRRIDRKDMTEGEEQVFAAFDIICFKGFNHQKRGHGITIFPLDVVEKCKKLIDLPDFVFTMFKNREQKNI